MLNDKEFMRYSRQLILPELTYQGQLKLKSARVLLIGLGALGSPVAYYLSAAGVGTLGLLDFDRVDLSNLHRQILYRERDIGEYKAEIVAERLREFNSEIILQVFKEKISLINAVRLIEPFDVIVDGSDNFPTRYLVNDACFFLAKPLVYGSIYRFTGQTTVFTRNLGPCYRCLFPKPPPSGQGPNCQEMGVIGALAGIIGSIQANEVIKLILGTGQSLLGRLLMLDALAMNFHEFRVAKNPQCPLCGEEPTISKLGSSLFDLPTMPYDHFLTWRLTAQNFLLLDVREPYEYHLTNLGGYLIPLAELDERLHELDKSQLIIVHCAGGDRARTACLKLKQAGFDACWLI